jgi:hypothetical protein
MAVTVKFTKAAKRNSRDHCYFMFYIIYIIIFCVHNEPFKNFRAAKIQFNFVTSPSNNTKFSPYICVQETIDRLKCQSVEKEMLLCEPSKSLHIRKKIDSFLSSRLYCVHSMNIGKWPKQTKSKIIYRQFRRRNSPHASSYFAVAHSQYLNMSHRYTQSFNNIARNGLITE